MHLTLLMVCSSFPSDEALVADVQDGLVMGLSLTCYLRKGGAHGIACFGTHSCHTTARAMLQGQGRCGGLCA